MNSPSGEEAQGVDGDKFICDGHVIDYACCCQGLKTTSDSSNAVAQMDSHTIREIIRRAVATSLPDEGAWSKRNGFDRIACIRGLMNSLRMMRNEIVRVLMWESCKSLKESTLEFDCTMSLIASTINDYEVWYETEHNWETVPVTFRSPVGIVLCWGSEVNSFIETFKMLIPAILVGNIVIVKIPCTGGLVHVLTMPAVAYHLPPNVVQYVVGAIDNVVAPLMSGGEIAMLALSGSRDLADKLMHAHPNPHRLKLRLLLDAETIAVVLAAADLHLAVREVTRTLRCNWHQTSTLKQVMVHYTRVEEFVHLLSDAVKELRCGLPWTVGVDITPLPGVGKPEYLQELLIDALRKGAMVVNSADGGGRLLPEFHGTVMKPAVVYPVNDTMRLWSVGRTGPIVSVTSFRELTEVHALIAQRPVGVQVSLFTESVDGSDGDSHAFLREIVQGLPSSVGAMVVNRICAEQCFEGYGGVPCGLNCSHSAGNSEALLRAFTAETSLHHFASDSTDPTGTTSSPEDTEYLVESPDDASAALSLSSIESASTSSDSNGVTTPVHTAMQARDGGIKRAGSAARLHELVLDHSVLFPTSFPSPVGVSEINKL